MNQLLKIIKRMAWKIIDIFPYKLRYLLYFRVYKKRWPNLKNPKDYSDFIFRDNYYGNHNSHAFLADKYLVRSHVESLGLGNILTKLYGVWDDASKIDFEKLPDQFAIKCNHSCGTNIICYDKSSLDLEETRKQLDLWMQAKHSIFYEPHYQYINPIIICEELIPDNNDGFFPMDYKIHCANGKPVFIQVCFERSTTDSGKRTILNPQWEDLHFTIESRGHYYSEQVIPRPKHLKEMLDAASILSAGLDYARVDFYDTDDRIIFGEITLTPMGGWLSSMKQECLDYMGEEIMKGKKRENGCR